MNATATRPRVLIAGIGNIFLGDDAFGVEVVRRLGERALPEDVRAADFGIRGYDLACELLEGYELMVLVDAVPRGGRPGTLYVIEPQIPAAGGADAGAGPALEMHNFEPVKVLRLATVLGGNIPGRVLVIGCEPTPFDPESYSAMQAGLSPPVSAAVDEAIALIEKYACQEGDLTHDEE